MDPDATTPTADLPGWDAMTDLDRGCALLHARWAGQGGPESATTTHPARYHENRALVALGPREASAHAREVTGGWRTIWGRLGPDEIDRLYDLACEAGSATDAYSADDRCQDPECPDCYPEAYDETANSDHRDYHPEYYDTDDADPDGNRCQTMAVDGEPVMLYGAPGPMSDRARTAFTTVVRAAREQFAEDHADNPPILAVVAAAVDKKIAAEADARPGFRNAHIARNIGLPLSAVSRLMNHSDTLTIGELAKLARWAGLDVTAVPRPDGDR